ncbi:MAG: ferritin [Phycisphaerae bacterium]|jgi:ferritin|nr:ferritin [Phycisphaerae bacterium]
MNKKIENAFNKQINAELYSSYLYLAMSAWLESKNFKGMAHWMRAQAGEEQNHARKFYDFIHDRGGRVKLAAIDAPPTDWTSPAAAFKEAYKHECKISAMIHGLVDLAVKEKDHPASNFLQWFVSEQVEEEAHASEIAEKLSLIGDSRGPIFMIDAELGKRGG